MVACDSFIPQPERAVDKPFLMPVEDVFSITGRGTVGTGRIESGKIKVGEEVEVVGKTKKVYKKEDKDEFMELVFGEWNYFADTRSLTKATFSEDLPSKAIKILTFKDDLVLDCFSGSGTTAISAKKLGRRYLGFEISKEYFNISQNITNKSNTYKWS